jgi:hypothetical protein
VSGGEPKSEQEGKKMEKNGKPADPSRRKFFGVLGGASTAALAAPLAVGEAEAKESQNDQRKARYRETDHVKTFYRTNRY